MWAWPLIISLMSSGLNPSLRLDATIIGPEEGMPVFIRMCPSEVVNKKTPSPLVPTKYTGPAIWTGSAGSSHFKPFIASSRNSVLFVARSSGVTPFGSC